MDELDSIIKQINEEFGEGTITTANEAPRPQSSLDREAFEDFNVRNPMAGGGMLVQPGFGGVRQGYNGRGGARPNTGGDRSQYIDYKARIKNPGKKFLNIAEKVHGNKPEYKGKKGFELWKELKDYQRSNIKQGSTTGEPSVKLKKNQIGKDDFIKLVNANKDKTYNQFVEILKDYKTKDNKPFTKNIVADRLRDYGLSGTFKKEPSKGKDLTKKAETEKKRQEFLKDTDPTGAKGTKKINYHHIRQIAGGVPLTTDDVMLINQRINSQLGGETNKALNRISVAIQKNNRLALEAMNAKEEGLALEYMKRSDDLNAQAEKIVNSAIDKLPKKYKGYVGFNQFTLPRDEYGLPISNEPLIVKKVGGMPVSKNAIDLTNLNLKQEAEFKKLVKAQAEAGKVGQIKGLSAFMKNLGIKCQLSNGINCMDPRAYEKSLNELSTKAQAGDQAAAAKMTNFAKSVRGAGSVIKGVLGPAALVFEAGIAVPLGLFEYSQGKPATEIVDSLTYGLFGKSREDRLKEQMPAYGQVENLQNIDQRIQNLERLQKGTRGQKLRSKPKVEKAKEEFQTAAEPFLSLEDPTAAMLENLKQSEDLRQKLIDEDLQRKEERKTPFDLSDPFMAAKGGRAGFKVGSLRKGIQALIDKSVKSTPKDTTPDLDALIKRTLDEDFFDKKDRIVDSINISEAKKRKNYPYNMRVFEEPKNLDFYRDIKESNFRTKTGPYYDRIRRRNKAGGGLLKQAGDRSGPPPESGPNPQGLQGLLNRVKKIQE